MNSADHGIIICDNGSRGAKFLASHRFGHVKRSGFAIAYRNDACQKSIVGHIVMVLDTSGSMARKHVG